MSLQTLITITEVIRDIEKLILPLIALVLFAGCAVSGKAAKEHNILSVSGVGD